MSIETFGQRLRRLRTARGLTQQQLADVASALTEDVGVPQSTIASFETGRRDNPEAKTLLALAQALDVDPRELFPLG